MREEILKELNNLSDIKYKKFHSMLCPESKNIIGVRTPILRKYAKELYKEYKTDVLKELGNEYYEEVMLQGMIICEITSVEKSLKYLEKFVPKIDNWAVCDTTCAGLKIVKKNREVFLNFIYKCLKSDLEFTIRFALVLLLDHYMMDEYIDEILKIINTIDNDKYYVKMANAWLISVCLVKYYDKTKQFLLNSNLDDFTYNKGIQKAIESYRINDNQKNELRKMKKKAICS